MLPDTLKPVSSSLLCFASTVNSYILFSGPSSCMVIDLGDGAVLDAAARADLRVTDLLLTHGHQTQLEGIGRLIGSGVRVHVNPEAAFLKSDAMESCISRLVPMRRGPVGRYEPPVPLPEAIEVARDLAPGAALRFGRLELSVLAAPGHDPEQVALLAQVDGRRVCFAGDAIHSPGKVYELFSTDTDHYTGTGARQASDTLATIRAMRPALVLASHGPGVSEDVEDALRVTEGLLRAYACYKDHLFFGLPRVRDLKEGLEHPWGTDGPCRMSEHLWALPGNTYVITSAQDSRACLLVDACAGAAEQTLRDLQRIGATRPEVILSTQYHYDHLPSPREKAEAYASAQLWAQEAVAYVAERGEAMQRPWLPEGRLKCERHLADGEVFRWREHTFAAHYMPGQTDGHAGYSAAIDGRKVVFSGDNFYHPHVWGGYGGICGFNGAWNPISGYALSARKILALAPEWVLCEHNMAMDFVPAMFEYVPVWADELAGLQAALSPGRDRARHCNPYLIAFEPFVSPFRAGASYELCVTLDNRGSDRPRTAELAACPPPGIEVDPARIALACGADDTASAACRVSAGSRVPPGKPLTLLPFSVWIDGGACGQRSAVFLDARL